jgi:hypothetical protein
MVLLDRKAAGRRDADGAAAELVSGFFAADPPGAAGGPPLPRAPDGVVLGGPLTELALAVLLAVVEGRRPTEAVDLLDGFGCAGGLHGPWLTRLPDALRDGLAAADQDDLRRFAADWLRSVELAHADPAATGALLAELAALARSARAEAKTLYFWSALRAAPP